MTDNEQEKTMNDHTPITDVMNIGNLGAAYPLVDPAYHVAEHALAIVIEFLLHGLR